MIRGIGDKPTTVSVGLMSGTSLDGVDAAVVRIEGSGLNSRVELLHFISQPYDTALRERLKNLCTPDQSNVALVCGMNVYLAELFAQAAFQAVDGAGLTMEQIDFVSSHGQTVWHIPQDDPQDPYLVRSTLQLGDLSVLAKRTGKPAVGDFRTADMAVGGQGAPLAPYGDLILFRHPDKGRLLQNIGGIGNCAAIPANALPDDVLALDTGPGNMVIDETVFVLSEGRHRYDQGGAWAAEGSPDEALVEHMLSHPYFELQPPKTTGRELFGKSYTREFLAEAGRRGLAPADIVATATSFTARSIADSYKKFVFRRYAIKEVIVTGGGAHNRTLMKMLGERLPEQTVMTSGSLGFNDDAKEAVIFAVLGNDFLHGVANNLPSATGASRPTIMGKLALP